MSAGKVLIVEDDENVLDVVQTWLSREGYEVLAARDGKSGIELMREHPDLVILDVILPGLDGLSVCKKLRDISAVPILMLSARSDTIDRVAGLEVGADDYLPKPFHPKELIARVRAIFRRQELDKASAGQPEESVGLRIDSEARKAYYREKVLDLTFTEYELLAKLSGHPNRAFSRNELLNQIWGEDFYGSTRVVDSHIRNLKAKVRVVNPEFSQIVAVRGVGYRFDPES